MSKDRPVLVTQNPHKLEELRPLFDGFGVRYDTTGVEKLEIRSEHVTEIAVAAAKHAHEFLNRPVIVDDTGLYITALGSFPGAYAAYVLKTIGNNGILRLLQGHKDRSAVFVTAVGYCDGTHLKSFEGEVRGDIATHLLGQGGFGYDPIFIPEGTNKTYAQLSLKEKVSMSHRTRAFTSFLKWYVDAVGKS